MTKERVDLSVFALIAAGITLLGGLASHPYSYYELLRWVVTAVGGWTAIACMGREEYGRACIFGVIAVVFNPLIPFEMPRSNWQVLDVAAALCFFGHAAFITFARRV